MSFQRRNPCFSKQAKWKNSLDVDEMSIADHQKLFALIETIYTEALMREVQRFCRERCCGCKIDHPSQRQHDCLMLTDEERWNLYCEEAKANVNERVWAEFNEALRVLKLYLNEDALEHLRHLERTSETVLYVLWEQYQNIETPEIKCILGYLEYWREMV